MMEVYNREAVVNHPLALLAAQETGRQVVDLLADLRVEPGEAEFPEQWAVSWTGTDIGPDTIHAVQGFALLAWVHSPESADDDLAPHRDHAAREVLKREYAAEWAVAQGYRHNQSSKGAAGAEARWSGDGRKAISQIVETLARAVDELGDPIPPKDLWPRLFAMMGEAHLDPTESCDQDHEPERVCRQCRIESPEIEPVTFDAFRKRIERARQ